RYRLRTQCGIVENNQLQRIWGTTRDITELKRAELAVEASERRFRQVLEQIQLPAFMLNVEGGITFYNDAFLHLTHLSKEDISATNWLDLIASPEEREVWAAHLSWHHGAQAAPQHFEGTIQMRDDRSRLIVWDTITLWSEDGPAAGLAAIGRDITEQK